MLSRRNFLAVSAATLAMPALASGEALKLAFIPQENPEKLLGDIETVTSWLSERMGVPVTGFVTFDHAAAVEALRLARSGPDGLLHVDEATMDLIAPLPAARVGLVLEDGLTKGLAFFGVGQGNLEGAARHARRTIKKATLQARWLSCVGVSQLYLKETSTRRLIAGNVDSAAVSPRASTVILLSSKKKSLTKQVFTALAQKPRCVKE